jgi:isopentenyldiphosphate isomerase
MAEIMDIVDENDKVIKQATRKEVRKHNLCHRSTMIFVFNSKGEIFVQKRTNTKDIYPGYYDMACGGGVQAGETYEKSAYRESSEELGLKNQKLQFLFKDRYESNKDRLLVHVFKTIYDGKLTLQKEEVVSGEFMSIKKLNKMLKKEKFCPDSVEMFKKFSQLSSFSTS